MAYKFQLGNARINGDVVLAGTAKLSGSLQSTQADDATAANIVSQIDDAEIPAAKVAATNNQILIGDGAGKAVSTAMQGDATIVANGTLTIGDDKVTYAKMQNIATGNRVLGRAGGSGEITETQVTDDMLAGSISNGKLSNASLTVGSTNIALGATASGLNGLSSLGLSNVGPFREIGVADSPQAATGSALQLRAGSTSGGGSNDIAGGSLDLEAGRGKGTGAGGSINFKVAPAAGSTGNGMNNLQNALVISQNKNAQFHGNLTVDGDLLVSGDTITMNVGELLVEDAIIQVAKGAADDAGSNNSGIQFGKASTNGQGAQLLYKNNDGGERVLAALDGDGSGYIKFKAANFIGALTGNADTATTATNATNVTITDNENENLNCAILFADGYTGNQGVESDGDLHYNPSTGRVTATQFAGDGSALTNLPLAAVTVQSKSPETGTLSFGVNVLASGGSNGEKVFRLPTSQALGDRIWIKAPTDTAVDRNMKITGSLAGPGLTIDGAPSISLESPDASVMLVFVGSNTWKVF